MTLTATPLTKLIEPHGGTLINRLVEGEARNSLREAARDLVKISLNSVNLADLEMIAIGGYSPLTGFMGHADYENVVKNMRLANGLPWTVPVTLSIGDKQSAQINIGQDVALVEDTENGERLLAILHVEDKYDFDPEVEAAHVYGTTDAEHPGVARLYEIGRTLLGGAIDVIDLPSYAETEFPDIRLTPAQTRAYFEQQGWRRVVAFQTRNPIHRAHEYIQKTAMEIVDGLLLHPLVGATKSDDIPADVRVESYRVILERYYPTNRVLLSAFPAAMRYAGPREAVFHAIARKNYGCSHFIVGRDHAGVGQYYGTYDAQLIFDEFSPSEIGITPLNFEHAFYCHSCQTVVTAKTCPHGKEQWVFLSGTQVRNKLTNGENLPLEFTRPEVSEILLRATQASIGQPV